ncbi:hypothetical protein [Amycolatopsis australiensis]|uniref:Uncharacterized protein n=1 Tax=Amycolatopsis australiensis TaxID=546364 RepID=A0A1K1SS05_9PSEU|nr:hypothetical protein [Amycolatopsis australiensis]SFW87082.1 hypothetical protein SAMN04489730_6589 [Amycolatopsis australiensis]
MLADAIAWAVGEKIYKPRQFDTEGGVKKNIHGDEQHFTTDWRNGNMGVRALAFTGGEIPTGKGGSGGSEETSKTPDESYRAKEEDLIAALGRATVSLRDMYVLKDEQDRLIIERLGLRPLKLHEDFPKQLTKIYAKYGKEEDPFATFPEDELPADPIEEWGSAQDDENEENGE